MTTNRSDYNKPRFNINSFLPVHLRNELSTSLFENLHNRFLSKDESVYQRGTIGKPSTTATDRLPESSVFRQAYQLQPHLSVEADSENKLMNWPDVINQLAKLGIDTDQVSDWGSTEQFNFAPPINPDKLINYRDYYWADTTTPEYITIQNVATVYQARDQLLQEQLTAAQSASPVDQQLVDQLQYELLLNLTQYRIATNASVGWDLGYFDDNGGVHASVSTPSFTVDFGVALTQGLRYQVNGLIVEPISVAGSVVTFAIEIQPSDDVTVNVPWFYGVNPGATAPVGEYGWFNTTDGLLYRYNTTSLSWNAVDPQPSNDIGFDQIITQNFSERQWADANKWVHRQFLTDTTGATQAQLPIIEYVQGTKLNEYLQIKYNWKYRATAADQFKSVTTEPSQVELSVRYAITNASPINDQFLRVSGDVTSTFTHGMVFSVESDAYPYQAVHLTVQESVYTGGSTTIYTTTPIDITVPLPGKIVPTAVTSLGDPYRGVHVHWVLDYIDRPIPGDVEFPYSPATQQQSIVVGQDTNVTIHAYYSTADNQWHTASGAPLPTTTLTGDTVYINGSQLTIELTVTGPTTFTLLSVGQPYAAADGQYQTFLTTKFVLFDPLEFLGGSNNLRVYVNQVRQADNYTESFTNSTSTTPIGFQQVGNTIVFNSKLPSTGDVVYVESHVVYAGDVGRELTYVRRSEADVYQLEQRSLVRFFRDEQIKYSTNQYPMFDIFDHHGNHTGQISPIWSFEESSDLPPNKFVGDRRIRVSSQRKVYHFVNDLVEQDDGQLFAYKRKVNGLYQLKTMWEYSKQYTPSLINAMRQHDGDMVTDIDGNTTTVTVDASNGDWELPDQMFYNPTHEARRNYSTTDIFAHYNSIITKQNTSGGIGTIVDFDYSVGGTIKEHNHAFDDWVSSLFASKASSIDIIDFAKHQHIDLLATIKQQIISIYGELASASAISDDQKRTLIEQRISDMFANDAWYGRIYGDSDSFNGTYGIPNVLTTVARMGLWPTFRPSLSYDTKRQINQMSTHIGSLFDLTVADQDLTKLTQQIIISPNSVVSSAMPSVGSINVGQYWYNTATRKLFRYTVSFQQSTTPVGSSVGQLWLNTTNNQISKWDGGGWVAQSVITSLSDYLVAFNIDHLLPSVAISFENKLFQVAAASAVEPKYQYTDLLATATRTELYNEYLRDSFYQFCKTSNVDPFVNSTYLVVDPFTWNYSSATDINYPNAESVGKWAGHTNGIYTAIFGTAVPHLEPWKLQGYLSKPTWWNQHYLGEGRRWKYDHTTGIGMWANIMNGVVPVGVRYPSGTVSTGNTVADGVTLPTYSFLPVNIANNAVNQYAPDDLLPVYSSDPVLSQSTLIRDQNSIDMSTIGDGWRFGDYAPVENAWRTSTDFVYDQLVIASRIDPIRFFFLTSGRPYTTVNQLNIDHQTGRVCNHEDTTFHGQFPPDYSEPARHLGVNQWYSNYFRFHDLDVTTSNLYHMWTDWQMVSAYAADSIIDGKSVDIFTTCDKLIDSDYSIVLKKSSGADIIDVDNLIVNTVEVGAYNITYNARSPRGYGDDWVYRISTSSPIPKSYQYYKPKKYLASYVSANTFQFTGAHKIVTGDLVRLQSSTTLPVPLNIFDDYYAIVTGNTFKLAHNKTNAIAGIAIDILSGTTDQFYIGVVRSTFVPLGGEHTSLPWTTFESDTDVVFTTSLPIEVTGVQSVVDFVIGYSTRLTDLGVALNTDISVNTDPVTGRAWTWDLELERLIDQIYVGLGTSLNILKQDQPVLSKEYVELNPFRLRCLVSPTLGMIGDIFDRGPNYLRGDPLVYDQLGRFFTDDQLFILRQDKQTLIQLDTNQVPQTDLLNSVHIGGMRLLADQFEHTIVFTPGRSTFGLVYDPYLGVEIQSLFIALEKNATRTGRPNLGGYFLSNGQLVENIDKTASNQGLFYDAYSSDEFAGYPEYARALLGYDSPDYLDDLRLTNKSKFNFWRGMIQAKGAKRTVSALSGAQQLTDVGIDEFWAYRKAKFGSSLAVVDRFDFTVGLDDIKQHRLRAYFPVNGNIELPAPYVAVTNDPAGRYVDYINKKPTLDRVQNYYIEPELTDVTDSVIKIANQVQANGSVATLHYINTDVAYDAFIINVIQETTVIGTFANSVYVDPASQYALISVPLSTPISVGHNEATVKINGVIGTINQDYVEATNVIYVKVFGQPNNSWVYTTVEVSIGNIQLINGTDFEIISPTTCRITYDLTNKHFAAYGIRPDYKRTNTFSVIDRVSGTIAKNIPVVMPQHKQYAPAVMLNIDSLATNDPAVYTESLVASDINIQERWGDEKVGQVWVDTSDLAYSDFHNKVKHPDLDVRLNQWGEVLPNARAVGYKWITSPVAPTDWVAYAESYDDPEGLVKLSGTPISKLYYRTRPDTDTAFTDWVEIDGEQMYHSTFAVMTSDLTSRIVANPFAANMQLSTTVEVFINGEFQRNVLVNLDDQTIELPVLPTPSDVIDLRLVSDEWRVFYASGADYQPANSSTDVIEYTAYTPHTITVDYIGVGEFVQAVNSYHFWVKDNNDSINSIGSSVKQLTQHLNSTVDEFAVICGLLYDPQFTNVTKYKYTLVALSGLEQLVTADDRYAVRVMLNDSIAVNDGKIRADIHYEWEMFREKQSYLIPTHLWNKLVESIVGYQLSNPSQPVPSLERQYYDQAYSTTSKYGIMWDQTIGDKQALIATINAVIIDPSIDTYPVDKDAFFDKYSFDTEANILETMDYIFKYFPIVVVNKIMIEVLTDFMVIAPHDPNLLKTSWISVSGTTVVEI